MADAHEDADKRDIDCGKALKPKSKNIIFKIELEEHTPEDVARGCLECVLCRGHFLCMDRSYCKLHETGKTWKIAKKKD